MSSSWRFDKQSSSEVQAVADVEVSCESGTMEQPKKIAAIIVAAGRGSRMADDAKNPAGPKQYRRLGGRSVLQRALDAFQRHERVDQCVVVIHPDDMTSYQDSVRPHPKLLEPVIGGKTRQDSVRAGLESLAAYCPSRVLIHDAARPFVDTDLLSGVIDGIGENRAALPAVPIADTIKRSMGGTVIETVERDGLFAAQTPQGFVFDEIVMAHRSANLQDRNDFTDDTALAEWAGMDVALIEGSSANSKITTAEDMKTAQQKLSTIPDIRTGHGYDTHRWAPGDAVWLCGVEIPHTHRLDGHSDADVGLHALTDALLSAIADGDIGSHFPPSDPRWKDARSYRFLAHAAKLVRNAGGTITHVDVTLICEAPKIGPHRDAMRETIATILTIEPARVSVKATTNEAIGFIGRGEGMAALATATVVICDDD